MILRPATVADLSLLNHWDEQPHVIASDPNDDWNWETELLRQPSWRKQLIAEVDGMPIGFVQIIDPASEDSHYWGDVLNNLRAIDIWIGDEKNLGKGLGTRMMHIAIAICFENTDAEGILLDPLASNRKAHWFYERFGFQPVERRKFGENECLVYRLNKKDWVSHPG